MRTWGPWLLGAVLAAAVVLVDDRFFYESIEVISSSMEPSLYPQERSFLKRFGFSPLKRFDVVVVRDPQFKYRIVKRVIGLPGECIELKEGWKVAVNARPFSYEAINNQTDLYTEAGVHPILLRVNPKIHYDTRYGDGRPYCLKEDEYYLLGDNRLASGDSRYYGAFRQSEIEGVLKYIWYSYDKSEHRFREKRQFIRVQ